MEFKKEEEKGMNFRRRKKKWNEFEKEEEKKE